MTEYNEWKIWNGGECPVKPGTMGHVQFADESRMDVGIHEIDLHSFYAHDCWTWNDRCEHIIAYRTVKEPVVEVVDGWAICDGLRKGFPVRITLTDGKVTTVELAE